MKKIVRFEDIARYESFIFVGLLMTIGTTIKLA